MKQKNTTNVTNITVNNVYKAAFNCLLMLFTFNACYKFYYGHSYTIFHSKRN